MDEEEASASIKSTRDEGSWDTSYVCVVDRYGNAFSATPSDVSNTTPVTPRTGLSVSSRGSQSWVDENHPSSIQGGKRPRLSPNPSMVLRKGRLFMPFGSPGGDVQCQAMLQVLLNIIEFQMDPQVAVEAPRFATFSFPNSFYPHEFARGLLKMEKRIGDKCLTSSKRKGTRRSGGLTGPGKPAPYARSWWIQETAFCLEPRTPEGNPMHWAGNPFLSRWPGRKTLPGKSENQAFIGDFVASLG